MSLVMMESADLPNVMGYAGKKWTVVPTGLTNDDDTQFGRKCWQSQNGIAFVKDFPSQEHATIVVGARYTHSWVNADHDAGFFEFWGDDGSVKHISITANADGSLDVQRGITVIHTSDPGVFPNNTAWFSIQAKVTIDDTVGAVEVQIDKNTVIDISGVDTRNGGTDALVDRIHFSGDGGFHLRDMYIATGDGSGINDLFVRPWLVEARRVDAAGDLSDFTPNTGTNDAAVDESDPDDDTTYNESTVVGNRDCFSIQDLVSITEDPVAVQAYCIARYLDSPLSLGTFLRRSATNDDGAVEDVVASWASHGLTIWETDPIAAGAWTIANFNATQFGYRSA